MKFILNYFEEVMINIKRVYTFLPKFFIRLMKTLKGLLNIFTFILIATIIGGSIVYMYVKPIYEKSREIAYDKLVNIDESTFEMLPNTVIYDNNNKKIGEINAGSYKYAPITKVSEYIQNGYIAVEDRNFKIHNGIDIKGTLRAGLNLIKNRGTITQGGSTITQQIIKNNVLTQEKSYTRKLVEVLLAPTVEAKFSKAQIMEFYVNTNFYGNRCYGVETACQYYFGKSANDVTLAEAALIVGLSNNPSRYNPIDNYNAAIEKKNFVLDDMLTCGYITKEQYNQASKEKIKIGAYSNSLSGKENYQTSFAVYCTTLKLMELDGFEFKYSFKEKKEYTEYKEKYQELYSATAEKIRNGGYKIYTSLDSNIQKSLQKSVDSQLKSEKEKTEEGKYSFQGSAICIDNSTNYVVAAVGGRGTSDEYNRAYLAQRQPGSTIKPLVDYTPAFETGNYYPSYIIKDEKIENGPTNSSGSYRGNVSIREAVGRSINTIAWKLLSNIGIETGLSYLNNMEFKTISYVDNNNLSISLGGFTNGIKVIDMAKGYNTLANNGQYSDRTCIRKITYTTKDDIVYEDKKETLKTVYNEDSAYMMTDVLKGVFDESYGTAHSLKSNDYIVAGKTGTTNDNKDAWFCGFSKYYTTVVWCGYDTPKSKSGLTGNSYPLKIWSNFMNKIHQNLKKVDFEKPNYIYENYYDWQGSEVDYNTGKKDIFSSRTKELAQQLAKEKEEKQKINEIKELVIKFEDFTIKDVYDTYKIDEKYSNIIDKINMANDNYSMSKYRTRTENKYQELLNDIQKNWLTIITKHEEELEREKEKNKELEIKQAELDRQAEEKRLNIEDVNYYIQTLLELEYYDNDNTESLVTKGTEVLKDCVNYSEYNTLQDNFLEAVSYARNLISYEEYLSKQEEDKKKEEQQKDGLQNDVNNVQNENNSIEIQGETEVDNNGHE